MKLSLLTAISAALLLLAAASSHAQADEATELEEGAIRVELSGIGERDMFIRLAEDTLYLPFARFCEFLKVNSSTSADGDVLKGELPAGSPFSITRSTGLAEHDTIRLRFDSSLVREVDGEIYVNASLLADCLGITIRFNYTSLRLVIDPDDKIPAVRLKMDRRKYARLATAEALAVPEEVIDAPIQRELLGSMTLAWALAGNYEQKQGGGTGSLQLGGPFLYGLLNVRGSGRYQPQLPDSKPFTGSLDSWDWQMVFPDFDLLRRFSVGAVMWNGLPPQYEVSISNERLAPLEDYSMHELIGHTQPGWIVEMYESDQLVAVTQADSMGFYRFMVPAGGSIQREFASVGPHGERILEDRFLDFNPMLIPQGEVEYTLNATTEKLSMAAPITTNGVLRAGVLSWLSLGGKFSVASSSYPHISRDSMFVNLNADMWLGGATSMGLRYNPIHRAAWGELVTRLPGNLYMRANIDSIDFDDMSFRSRASFSSTTYSTFFYGATGTYARSTSDYTFGVTPQLSGSLLGLTGSVNTRFEWNKRWGSGTGELFEKPLNTTLIVSTAQVIAPITRWMSMTARGTYDHMNDRFGDVSLRATLRPFRQLGINVGWSGSVYEKWRKGIVSANLTFNFGTFQTRFGADYQENRSIYYANSSTRGATRFSSAGIDYSDQASMGNAAIIVRGFWDKNGNGIQDDDEPELNSPRATVRYGHASAVANDGRFLSIPVYRECVVEIDRASYIGEGLYPTVAQYDLYSLPSSVNVVRVPFAEGFEVSGECTVELPGGVHKVPGGVLNGLAIRLISTTGNIVIDGEVFDDGSVLISGVPAGEYKIELSDEQLAGRRIRLKEQLKPVHLSEDASTLPTIIFEPGLDASQSIGK